MPRRSSIEPIVKRRLNTREASAYTGIPMSTLRMFRYEGRGSVYSNPAGWALYDVADLDAFIRSGLRIPRRTLP
jgi:hypothetical protein